MKRDSRQLYIYSAAVMVLFLIVLVFLDLQGRHARIMGAGHPLHEPRLPKMTVDDSVRTYDLWKQNAFKGRIIISLSSRLNFVSPGDGATIPAMFFPLRVFRLSRAMESTLGAKNFLLVSLETGIAREIIHIVPPAVFSKKSRYAATEQGVTVDKEKIVVPYFGSPRVITTMPFLKAPTEPVLLYVNASIFKQYEPGQLLRLLNSRGLKTDFLVLSRATDDPAVTDRERDRLRTFEKLLGAVDG